MTTSFRRSLPAVLLAFAGFVSALSVCGATASRALPLRDQAAPPVKAQEPASTAARPQEPNLTVEQMKTFLRTAKVIRSRGTPKGITSPWHLTLTDGTITHDAAFQAVDEQTSRKEFADGTVELNFVDSYRYDIAAYELATLLGLGDMMPVTVERTWESKTGAISWWLPVAMDEQTRLQKKIHPPDVEGWNRQMYKKRIFAELVYDTDPNLTNVLISSDWHLWMIDFSRAFRLYRTLRVRANVEGSMCSRELLDHLRKLTRADVQQAVVGKYLTRYEIDFLMDRRDVIVRMIDDMVAKKGERAVLFSDKGPSAE